MKSVTVLGSVEASNLRFVTLLGSVEAIESIKAWETKFLAQSLFSVFLNFQALTLGEDISSRRRLFLNRLGRNQYSFSPYILYKVTTKTVHCGHNTVHCSHKGYPL